MLTKNHVVDEADEIIVSLSDRREYKAELIGSDERSDLALLKIEADNLPVVKIGNSNQLKVGEWVFAIGSLFSSIFLLLQELLVPKEEVYLMGPILLMFLLSRPMWLLIQEIRGAPLFNLEGKVFGINSQIYTRSGGYMGVSFAIPIDYAMDIFKPSLKKVVLLQGVVGSKHQEVPRILLKV
ncbi:MAG: hypothetical protein CM1200mP12_02150 [Gammaproteobacteria bacterium]|nr:MAG: hypothetical protein CM1200mP12_02150 [Gammaproteobacteria bacterium]